MLRFFQQVKKASSVFLCPFRTWTHCASGRVLFLAGHHIIVAGVITRSGSGVRLLDDEFDLAFGYKPTDEPHAVDFDFFKLDLRHGWQHTGVVESGQISCTDSVTMLCFEERYQSRRLFVRVLDDE